MGGYNPPSQRRQDVEAGTESTQDTARRPLRDLRMSDRGVMKGAFIPSLLFLAPSTSVQSDLLQRVIQHRSNRQRREEKRIEYSFQPSTRPFAPTFIPVLVLWLLVRWQGVVCIFRYACLKPAWTSFQFKYTQKPLPVGTLDSILQWPIGQCRCIRFSGSDAVAGGKAGGRQDDVVSHLLIVAAFVFPY